MPWHVTESDACPASTPWAVVKDSDGEIEGCHPSKDAADEQMAALYAKEPEMHDAPTSDLIRSTTFELVTPDADDDTDGRTLEGYAAVFNTVTRIDSWEGEFDEVIAPGAFKRSISHGTPVLMFEHGRHPMYGTLPIGRIQSLREDGTGLFVRAPLFDHWLNAPLGAAIREGAIDGMSFRFSVTRESWQERRNKVPLRTIEEAKVHELGPVVFPAYADTTVALRSLHDVLGDDFPIPGDPPPAVDEVDTPTAGTPEEPAPERGTSDGPANTDDPVPDHASTHTTRDERRRRARQIAVDRLARRKG